MRFETFLQTALAALIVGLQLPPALAQANLIVDHLHVAEAVKRGVVIWDVRAETEYRKGHIPGAINIGDAGQVLRNPNTEDFIAFAQIERILGAAGIDPGREVVVYGTRASVIAYFGLYTMQFFGAANTRVYHDGIDGWRAAGLALAADSPKPAAVALKLTPRAANHVTTAEMISRLKNPNVQILDVRTPGEFAGEDIRAIRGGHIPGAVNIPYEQNWIDPDTVAKLARRQVADNAGMSLKPRDTLRSLYAQLDPGEGNHRLLPVRRACCRDRHRAGRAGLSQRQGLRLLVAGLRQHARCAGQQCRLSQRRRAQ